MINKILKHEEELLATLVAIKTVIEENNIVLLNGMIDQLDKLIRHSEYVVGEMHKLHQKDMNENK